MSEKAVPPNPFDNPAFRAEFHATLKPLSDDVAEHGKQLSYIKAVGSLISLILGYGLWFLRGGK